MGVGCGGCVVGFGVFVFVLCWVVVFCEDCIGFGCGLGGVYCGVVLCVLDV